MNILNVEHIKKVYGDKVLMDDVSLGINEGDKIGVIGVNGCGKSLGAIIRVKPEQCIRIGRDNTVADMIVNLPLVSRLHCEITYHADHREYEIIDYSSNGTFVNGDKRLLPKETYILKPGAEVCFGDRETIYKLG